MSKSMLIYASRGMNLGCTSSLEFQDGEDWYRVERLNNGTIKAYKKVGAYWKPDRSRPRKCSQDF